MCAQDALSAMPPPLLPAWQPAACVDDSICWGHRPPASIQSAKLLLLMPGALQLRLLA